MKNKKKPALVRTGEAQSLGKWNSMCKGPEAQLSEFSNQKEAIAAGFSKKRGQIYKMKLAEGKLYYLYVIQSLMGNH